MLADWKTYLALALTLGPIVLRFIPFTAPLVAAFLQTSLGRGALLALAIVAGSLWLGAYYQSKGVAIGAQKTQERIQEQDDRAVRRAIEHAIPVTECYQRNGVWDQERGKCIIVR